MSSSHRAMQGLVDAHFAGRIVPEQERTMRAHLFECQDCRARYERHLLLDELDPRARGAKERLAIGLGLQRRSPAAQPATSTWGLVVVAMACCALLLLPAKLHAPHEAIPAEFAARGSGLPFASETPSLQIYRLRGQRAPELVRDVIAPDDELAFAYTNPSTSAFEYMLIFGTDENGRVYWYHPAWTDPHDDPSAIPIVPGSQLHELSEAVRHPLMGRELSLLAVFSHDRITVQEVERLMHNSPSNRLDVHSAWPRAAFVRASLRVER
jgi:hypothetical protein